MVEYSVDVSIIIVNFNTFDLTVNCITSVFEKTKGVTFEIVLVDNASTECDADAFKSKFEDIILIKSDINLGFSGGNNIGIKQAKGKCILLLNSDTLLINDAVSIAYDLLEADASIGVLSGQLVYPDGKVQNITGRFPTIKSQLMELLRINSFLKAEKKAKLYHGEYWNYDVGTETDWLWGAFFMMPRTVLQKFPNGRLHEDFFMYYEDVLWSYHIKHNLGLKVIYSPLPKLIHFHGGSSTIKKDMGEHFKRVILPNELSFLVNQKSQAYAFSYYLLKGLHFLTLRKPQHLKEARFYFKFLYRNLMKSKPQ